ncbi:MAG: inositol monophosphatase family protein [Gammaproteobacteria bacterium]|nr:inositol monophosphatase family protein [Gammaproteobacteria bacterium]
MKKPTEQHLQEYFAFANTLANVAQSITLPYFTQGSTITYKVDESPVTEADTKCEKALREYIKTNYPTHGILGEEYGIDQHDSLFTWVIDPIDGTKSFIDQNPEFGTLIALLYDGKPIVSIIDMPALSQRYSATYSSNTRCNNNCITTSMCKNLNNAIISWTSDSYFNDHEYNFVKSIQSQCHTTIIGGDCYLFAKLANGTVDIVIEAGLKPWDYMALILIVEQSGGIITDWQGNPLTLHSYNENRGQVIACANPQLHSVLMSSYSSFVHSRIPSNMS